MVDYTIPSGDKHIDPLGVLTRDEEAIIRLVRRKPALAPCYLQLGEMLIGRRNCRTQIEVVDGILRRYDVTPTSGNGAGVRGSK